MRHPDDHHGSCDHCSKKMYDTPIRAGHHGDYCSEACASKSACVQCGCTSCRTWLWLGSGTVITTVRGVYCGPDCVTKAAGTELEAYRGRFAQQATCRVCHTHPSTPAFTWCCSRNCEEALFAQKGSAA